MIRTFETVDTKKLKERFGDQISFWGGIDIQEVLPGGNKEKIEQEVRTKINDLGPGGGYILAPAHNIQLGVTPESLLFMFARKMKPRVGWLVAKSIFHNLKLIG